MADQISADYNIRYNVAIHYLYERIKTNITKARGGLPEVSPVCNKHYKTLSHMKLKNKLIPALLLLMGAIPTAAFADVEINEENFPDANFRTYVATFDEDGDSVLSEEEIAAVTKIDINTVADFTGIENFTSLTVLYSRKNSALKSIDLSENVKLKDVRINNNAIESIDVSMLSKLQNLYIFNNKLTALDVSANLNLKDLQCNNNNISSLILPEEQINPNDNKLVTLICTDNPNIKAVDVTYFPALTSLQVTNCGLDELDVRNNTKLQRLYCNRNNLTTLDVTNNTALTSFTCSYNQLTELDVSNNTKLTLLECRENQLTVLNVSTLTALTNLNCSNNKLTSIDLSNNPLTTTTLGTQNIEVDVTAINFEGFGLEILSSNPSTLNVDQFSAFEGTDTDVDEKELVDVDGKKYLVLGKPTNDVDLWDTELVYVYTASYANGTKTMKVKIKAYPFVMYFHPDSRKNTDNQYTGTLYLNYDAVVPEGVKAFVATSMSDTDNTITMTRIPTEGQVQVIPAETPVYLEAASSGLYAFGRNLKGITPAAVPEGNILQGTLRNKSVTKVLTLGRERKQGEDPTPGAIGFWPYEGTQVKAHRAYIDNTNNSNGYYLDFDGADGIAQLPASSSMVDTESWYNMQGVKVNGQPTQKGLYISNGKKMVIK